MGLTTRPCHRLCVYTDLYEVILGGRIGGELESDTVKSRLSSSMTRTIPITTITACL